MISYPSRMHSKKNICKFTNVMKVHRTYCSCDVHSGSDISMFLLPTHVLSTPSSYPLSPIMSHSFPVKVYYISILQTHKLWNLPLMESTKHDHNIHGVDHKFTLIKMRYKYYIFKHKLQRNNKFGQTLERII